jgi:glycosyltransferase involved in cell wall biosynthesis
MPLALMEAMAMGMPCLCTDIPENRDVAQSAAEYFEPGNVGALTSALVTLLRNRAQMDALGRLAHRQAAAFDARCVADRLLFAIESALSGPAS